MWESLVSHEILRFWNFEYWNIEIFKHEGFANVENVFDGMLNETAEYKIDIALWLQAYKMLICGWAWVDNGQKWNITWGCWK